ncbi:MAG TPA: DUF6443 domain-containing protein, partial [Pedobacter sp.]
TLCILEAYSQPAAYSNTSTVNYVRTWDATAPETDASILISRPVTDVKQTTQYLDGLGRPLQTVMKRVTPLQKDMVAPVIYDAYGREVYKYLPYVSTADDGVFKYNPFQLQSTFYSDANGVLKGQGETYFYGQTDFEPSPLNRVSKTFAPGNSWVGSRGTSSEKSIQQQYLINTIADDIQVWSIGSAQGSIPTSSGAYPAGTLYKNVSVDEAGHAVAEYKDKEGKVILKKVQLSNSPGNSHTGWLCTYYVYDELNNLRFVLQPKAVESINGSWSISQGIADELCFRYEYDHRNRMILKKVPGAGEVWMVYDARDRLVMVQDANQRTAGKWMVTVYENTFNRPVKTGLLTDASSRSTHEANAIASTGYPSIASNFDMLTQNFYDDYSWVSGTGSGLGSTIDATHTSGSTYFVTGYNTAPVYAQAITPDYTVKGMPTGSMVKVLGTTQYLYTVNFYDENKRVIQTQSINISGGKDVATMQYDFSGKVIRSLMEHHKNGTNAQTHAVLSKMAYDHAGRMLTVSKIISSTVNSQGITTPEKVIVQNQYDELGQLKNKILSPAGSTPLEIMSYDYNIRGWTLGANRDYAKTSSNTNNYFGFDLGYDKTISVYTAPQYNGNITGTEWKTKGDNEVRKYDFTYDAVNRLTGAVFVQPTSSAVDFSVSNLTYDANGNIGTMSQKGLKLNTSPFIDQLSYTYQSSSNKLQQVADTSNDNSSKLGDFKYDGNAKTSTDYSYDVNGNMTVDNNKKISSITYNHLNLPQTITITGKGSIEYVYDAAGNKLKKIVHETGLSDKTTSYVNGFI